MSGKLDQSLEEISTAHKRSARRNPRRSAGRPAAIPAPVGGIRKNPKGARGAGAKATPAKAISVNSESKIIVSNLPKDVTEQQIKEYFVKSVGSIKRVDLVYGPNSQSRGIANISFHKSDGASDAFKKLNGLLVDGRPIKIEIVVGAAQADKVIPRSKTLAERTTQPKAQPKSAAGNKKKPATGKPGAKPDAVKGAAKGRSGRPTKKTAEELDSEMADYFVASGNNENATTAAPAAPATGDAPMEDEIM